MRILAREAPLREQIAMAAGTWRRIAPRLAAIRQKGLDQYKLGPRASRTIIRSPFDCSRPRRRVLEFEAEPVVAQLPLCRRSESSIRNFRSPFLLDGKPKTFNIPANAEQVRQPELKCAIAGCRRGHPSGGINIALSDTASRPISTSCLTSPAWCAPSRRTDSFATPLAEVLRCRLLGAAMQRPSLLKSKRVPHRGVGQAHRTDQ